MARTENMEHHAFRLELHTDEDGNEKEKPVTFDIAPYTSFWRQPGAGIISLSPIESQL